MEIKEISQFTKLDTRNNLHYNLRKVDSFCKNGNFYIEYKLNTITIEGATEDRLKNTYTVIAELKYINEEAPVSNSLYLTAIAAIVETENKNYSTLTKYGILELCNEILDPSES